MATPLNQLSARDLIARLKPEDFVELSPEAQENRARAADELSSIYELRQSGAFQWFMAAFIDGPHRDALETLKNPHTADLVNARTRYLALREIKVALLEREIQHRELMTPADEEIPRLREQLTQL